MTSPGDGIGERELLLAAQDGDREAFDALVALHARMVLAIARRITRSREDAEDAAQEVFVRLYRSLAKLDAERGAAAWLVRATLNVARSFVTRSPRRREDALDGAPERADLAADPTRPLREVQFRSALEAAVGTLSAREREVFTLRDVEGLDVDLIAAALSLSEVTVRRQSGDARRKVLAWFRVHRPEYVQSPAAPVAAG